MTQQPLNATRPESAPSLALGPTRPDKLTLWPVESDRCAQRLRLVTGRRARVTMWGGHDPAAQLGGSVGAGLFCT